MGSDQYRINVVLRHGAMSASSMYRNRYLIHRCHVFSITDTDLPAGNSGHDMLPDHRARLRMVQHSFPDHKAGSSGKPFFSGLKDELHRSPEFTFYRLENSCGPKKRGSVYVMPAGVHNTLVLR